MIKVCVAGLWHLGLVTASGLADLGYEVTGFEDDAGQIENFNKAQLPLFEPGLEDLVGRELKNGSLRFESDAEKAVKGAAVILVTYDTPVNDNDEVDLSPIEKVIERLLPHLTAGALVVLNSQIPVGSCEKWQRTIEAKRPGAGIELVYAPENLRLGHALELFKKPDMIVIGSNTESARKKAETFYSLFTAEKFFVSWRTAEMSKHALNVFFATSISFANEIGNLCDAIGADGMDIARILKQDSRIGKKAQVRPGLGFAGATLARDLRALQRLGQKCHVPTRLTDSVYDINQRQMLRVVEILEECFLGNLRGKTVTVFGLTYKPGTSTLRRSASLEIMGFLKQKGALLRAHDPKANLDEYRGERVFDYFTDPYEAVRGAEALLLLTEWPEYRELDYEKIKTLMGKTKLVLDAKNHLGALALKQKGYDYFEIGRGQLKTAVKSC